MGLWNSILPEGHFLNSDNLKLYESAVQAEPIYILAKNAESELQGILYLQKNQVNLGKVGGRFLSILKPGCKGQAALELIIVGNTYSTDSVGVIAINKKIETQIYSELLQSLARLEISYDGIIIKDLDQKIYSPKFKIFEGDFGMEMALHPEWASLEDYSGSLEKKYFKRFKKIRNGLKDIEVKEIKAEEFKLHEDAVWDLFSSVLQKQSTQVGTIKKVYFQEFLEKNKSKFKGYFKNEKLIAFALYHEKSKASLDVHLVGLDYDENEKHSLYLNILFDSVAEGIGLNKSTLCLGRTALTAKSSLGAEPKYKIQYYYFKNKIIHWSFKYILKSLYEKQVLEVRSPFKERLN